MGLWITGVLVVWIVATVALLRAEQAEKRAAQAQVVAKQAEAARLYEVAIANMRARNYPYYTND